MPACAWLCNKMMCAWSGAAWPGWAWWRLWRASAMQAATLLAAAWQRFASVPPFLAPCDAADYDAVRQAAATALPAGALAAALAAGVTLVPAHLVGTAE